MKLKTRFAAVGAALRSARDERIARRRLAHELAAFVTPQERAELDSMLGRHTLDETREIREILNRQDTIQQYKAVNLISYRG